MVVRSIGNSQVNRVSAAFVIPMITILFFSIILLSIVLHSRASVQHIAAPPMKILPGNELPENARCNWSPTSQGDMLYCNLSIEDKLIYFAYDTEKRAIVHTSVPVEDGNVGDLILDWGNPTGVRWFSRSVEVQWGTRSVFVSTRPFNPANRALFISYSLEPNSGSPWIGFASK
jgi:hypothetical protein